MLTSKNLNDGMLSLRNDPDFFKIFSGIKFGVEKEAIRINPKTGELAQTTHPKKLGSALTNKRITTDFSESLMEFVTKPHDSIMGAIKEIREIETFTAQHLDNEVLWPLSMPCKLPDDDSNIRLADYGKSHLGQLKKVYRRGLGYRYGRQMQMIAGMHFNISFPEVFWQNIYGQISSTPSPRKDRDLGYFRAIRNIKQIEWLFLLLTGASPSFDRSFRIRERDRLKILKDTLVGLHSTSLRMSDFGYRSTAQSNLKINCNNLPNYCSALLNATTTPWAPYEAIGSGYPSLYKQLSTSLLQIENEYYSGIRPKCNHSSEERPIEALSKRGVEYLEIRFVDLNPFSDTGIEPITMALLTLLITRCAILKNNKLTIKQEEEAISKSIRASWCGRDDNFSLRKEGKQILEELDELAIALDKSHDTKLYSMALASAKNQLDGLDSLPSDDIFERVTTTSHLEFGVDLAIQYHNKRAESLIPKESRETFEKEALESIDAQKKLEENSIGPFSDYIASYMSPENNSKRSTKPINRD